MKCCEQRELCAGAFLIRFGLGVLMLVASVGKFILPSGAKFPQVKPEFYQYIEKTFGTSGLPGFMWQPFGHAIPWIELALGILLILGIARFWVGIGGALYMLGLAFGMMIARQHATVANNYIYFGLFAAYVILSRHDRFCVDSIFRRRPARETVVAPDR